MRCRLRTNTPHQRLEVASHCSNTDLLYNKPKLLKKCLWNRGQSLFLQLRVGVVACCNCGIVSSVSPCNRCKQNKQCGACNRFLPSHCYSRSTNVCCQTCIDRHGRRRSALNGVVATVEVPLDSSNNESFESVVHVSDDFINHEVDVQLTQHR